MALNSQQLLQGLARTNFENLEGEISPAVADWLIDAGMGPMALAGLKAAQIKLSEAVQEKLTAVSLSGRFESANRTEALVEIISQAGKDSEIGLLKGMLFAHNFYAEPHFRPMGDIDLLVAPEKTDQLVEVLFDLGYINRAAEPPEYFATHHHLMPFYHEEKKVWVEVHNSLFPKRSGLAGRGPFDPDKIHQRTRDTKFCGLLVKALSKELQLFHTTVHWAEEFRRIGGILGLMDACMLMFKYQDDLNWDWIFSQSNNPAHLAPAQLALSYLEKADLIQLPVDVRQSLQNRGNLCKTAMRAQFAILDRFVILGESPGGIVSDAILLISWKTLLHEGGSMLCMGKLAWNIAFPEEANDRYKLSFQLNRLKNLRSRL